MEKLEWRRYPTVKKFRRYVYSFWRDPRTWQTDGRTDGRTDTAWEQRPRLCIALRGKNRRVFANYVQMKKGPVFLLTVYIYVRRRTQWAYQCVCDVTGALRWTPSPQVVFISYLFCSPRGGSKPTCYCCAMLYKRSLCRHAVLSVCLSVCLSACLSVMFIDSVETNKCK